MSLLNSSLGVVLGQATRVHMLFECHDPSNLTSKKSAVCVSRGLQDSDWSSESCSTTRWLMPCRTCSEAGR